jgi:hypothetical protein
MANSNAIGVAYSDPAIDGGTIENTAIGQTTPAAVKATTLVSTGASNIGGTSAVVIGFYGATGTTQRAASAMPAIATTVAISSSTSATCFGFTSAQANGIIALINELRAAAVALGLIAT